MHVFSRIAIATAAALMPTFAAQANTQNEPGKILFARRLLAPVTSPPNEVDYFPSAVGLFTVRTDGSHLHQITPLKDGHLYLSGLESNALLWGLAPTDWLSRNFSNGARHLLYFDGFSSDFVIQAYSISGKYRIRDPGGHSHALFPGGDDVSAGYGFVTWGPPGSNEVAYTNAAENHPHSPACVFLVHPDGSGAHRLWCAPEHVTPTSVSNLRWSGDGRSLLVYVNWDNKDQSPPNWGNFNTTELWRIKIPSGAATRVSGSIDTTETNSADISFDGSKVIFEQQAPLGSEWPPCDPDAMEAGGGALICLMDMTTGKTTVEWNGDGGDTSLQLLIQPSGKHLVASGFDNPPGATSSESDLYLVRTSDASIVRKLTRRPAKGLPDGSRVAWQPVAWSRDGRQLLVNRYYFAPHIENVVTEPVSDVYVINIRTGRVRRVAAGFAQDWYQPGS